MTTSPAAGLCDDCRHAQRIASRRSEFLRCRRSDDDPAYARYPRLPVLVCAGYAPGGREKGAGARREQK